MSVQNGEALNIVLGGTSGLGKEIVTHLRKDEREVLVLGSSYDVEKHGEGAQVDLASEASVEVAVDVLRVRLGDKALSSFWWVSGYGYNGDFSEQDDPRRMGIVNYAGALPLVQLAEQKIVEQGEGTLAIVSSTTGVKERDNEAVYAGAKAAQVHFARSLGKEIERVSPGSLAKVTLFMPGGMRTPFWDGDRPGAYDSFNDPGKVAAAMIEAVDSQTSQFEEHTFERGTLA